MFTVDNYSYVESIDELKNGSAWIEDGNICVVCLGIFHDTTNINYPHAFKYHESLDTHCCGDWYPCTNRDMITGIDKEIECYKQNIEELRNLRKTLKENI